VFYLDERNYREIINNYFHLFYRNSVWYGYANIRNKLWILSDKEALIVQEYLNGLSVEDIELKHSFHSSDIEKFLRELIEGITPEKYFNQPSIIPDLKAMLLIISEKCNFSCTYCYGQYGQKEGMMSVSTALNAVKFAANEGIFNISFFGGEPLLNMSVIKAVTEYIESEKLSISLALTTNGSLVTEEVAKYFAAHNIRASVSMDGTEAEHNKTRISIDGQSTYKEVKRGLDYLRQYGVLSMIEITYSARHTLNLRKLIDDASSLCSVISCTCVDGKPDSPHCADIISGDKLINYYRHMLDVALDTAYADSNITIMGVKELYDSIGKFELSQPYTICSYIGSRMVVSTNGFVYPCPEAISPKYCMGNINNVDFDNNFYALRKVVLDTLSSKKLNAEWFSYLCDTCIQHIDDTGVRFNFYDPKGFGQAIEEVLIRYASENEA